jgi:transposase
LEVKEKGKTPCAICLSGREWKDPRFRKESLMPRPTSARPGAAKAPFALARPAGQLGDRVRAAGPERFGILCFDCAKQRSRYFLADFYGRVLLEPATAEHTRGALRAAIDRVRQAVAAHGLADLAVAIERTGEYHHPVHRAFREAGFDTRLVHPHATKQYRRPADPGNKTDDTDLAAIFRAAAQGFGLCEPDWPADYVTLQVVWWHRRDLMDKTSILRCQIREKLHAAMPGYAGCFCHLWETPVAMLVARATGPAGAVLAAGLAGLRRVAAEAGVRCREQTLCNILACAEQAPPGHPQPLTLRPILCCLDDRLAKARQIKDLERQLAGLIAATPYALLLAVPGVNVVSVADLAGELGPMELHRDAGAITGRAGLVPCRYQSDRDDHPDGPLRRRGNRRRRAVLMQAADNLIHSNHYFSAKGGQWRRQGKDERWMRVKVAKQFSRLAYAVVAGRQIIPHPCRQQRHYVLRKLLGFHAGHGTAPAQLRRDLEALAAQLPEASRGEEARPLQEQLEALARQRPGRDFMARFTT